MTTIQLTFPWGRYCAHPWAINPVRLREAEWPPSPWRLFRSLVAAWFRRNQGIVINREAITVIERLGNALPEIGMGKIAFGCTVHYQPNYGKADAKDKANARYNTARHENHFVAVDGPVLFRWSELDLPSVQAQLLSGLLDEITYFGRSESLCHAQLLTESSAAHTIGWCKPVSVAGGRKISSKCRDVFCPRPGDFRITDLWAQRKRNPKVDDQEAPKHLVDTLLTTDMKADGAAWVSYEMPDGWPEKWVVRTPGSQRITMRKTVSLSDGPKVARYLRFSLQCRVPIPQRFTVDIAERFRSAAISYFPEGVGSYALLGKPERPDLHHQHAFYLPTATDAEQPGMLTDLHLWCQFGLTREEVDVLLRVHRLRWGSGRYPANPVLVAMAMEPEKHVPIGTGNGRLTSRIWRSVTPFVPSLHFYRGGKSKPKVKGNALPEKQLVECLRRAGINEAVLVKRLQPSSAKPHESATPGSIPPMPFWEVVRTPEGNEPAASAFENAVQADTHHNSSDVSSRSHERRIGFFLQLEFDSPVELPIPALGHSCHFGLGLFVPAE